MKGWYDMACWNGLSPAQQDMLIDRGVLLFGHWEPEGGTCTNGAQVAVEWEGDAAPGPTFFCIDCAIEHLATIKAALS